ncbi:MAG TPA: hypothetical protein PKE47_10515 [Verrucomicrobiota bacterium]|nr:hypothetical protein [Verrucomicrobiota bacterium]
MNALFRAYQATAEYRKMPGWLGLPACAGWLFLALSGASLILHGEEVLLRVQSR